MALEQLLAIFVEAGVPTLLWGPPGCGKTARVRALAERLGRHCETVLLSIREPTELCGLPVISEGEVRLVPPSWAIRLTEANKPGLLFLDELTTCPPAVQAAALRVVLERVVGDHALPPDTAVVAAANPPELAAGGWELAAPLANRFAHVEADASDFLDWLAGREPEFEVPTASPVAISREFDLLKKELAAFLKGRRELVCSPKAGARAWPSPRSWEFGLRALALARAARIDIQLDVLAACVGRGPATEFISHLRTALPDPVQILTQAHSWPIDRGRLDWLARVNDAVVDHVVAQPTADNWLAAWTWLGRQVEAGVGDAAMPAAQRLVSALYERIADLGLIPQIRAFLPLIAALQSE